MITEWNKRKQMNSPNETCGTTMTTESSCDSSTLASLGESKDFTLAKLFDLMDSMDAKPPRSPLLKKRGTNMNIGQNGIAIIWDSLEEEKVTQWLGK